MLVIKTVYFCIRILMIKTVCFCVRILVIKTVCFCIRILVIKTVYYWYLILSSAASLSVENKSQDFLSLTSLLSEMKMKSWL